MARVDVAPAPAGARSANKPVTQNGVSAANGGSATMAIEPDKTLPLPGWLVKVYFIFPVILYIPDAIFNYFVYSDGAVVPKANLALQVGEIALWAFMAIGIVGMAYLLSMLAPWHWGQGHHMQAIFCGVGVVVATAITTWNSLAFRSTHFQAFPTDTWVYQTFPQLHDSKISLTMVLVAIAPPFWGLFWAIVQPTQTGRSLRQIRESHEERLLRLQQEAELKQLRAEANATIREAQLRGMAKTAAAAREQAAGFFRRGTNPEMPVAEGDPAENTGTVETISDDIQEPANVLALPSFKPNPARDLAAGGRGNAVFMNRAAPAGPAAHAAPVNGARAGASQPPLLSDADTVEGPPRADAYTLGRRPPTPGGGIIPAFFEQADAMTGTTGPRAAIRRPGDNNILARGMTEGLSPRGEALMNEVLRELNPSGKKSLPRKEITTRLAQKLNGDEATAQKMVDQWHKMRKAERGGNAPG